MYDVNLGTHGHPLIMEHKIDRWNHRWSAEAELRQQNDRQAIQRLHRSATRSQATGTKTEDHLEQDLRDAYAYRDRMHGIVTGTEPADDGGNWAAQSRIDENRRWESVKDWAIYLGATFAEVGLNYTAFQLMGSSLRETAVLAASIILVNVLLPKQLGELLARARRARRGRDLLIAGLAGGGLLWVGVSLFVAQIRTAYLLLPSAAAQLTGQTSLLERAGIGATTLTIGWLLVVLAVGTVVLLRSATRYPGQGGQAAGRPGGPARSGGAGALRSGPGRRGGSGPRRTVGRQASRAGWPRRRTQAPLPAPSDPGAGQPYDHRRRRDRHRPQDLRHGTSHCCEPGELTPMRVRWLSTFITCTAALALLAGCAGGGGQGEPGALAVIVGAHANMVAPSLINAVQDEIATASDLGSPATVIVPDGTPTASAPVDLATPNDNPLYKQDQIAALNTVIDRVRADTPEVDLLAALALAARSVADVAGPRTIIVIDSGLQTSGALRFQDSDGALLDANPNEVVDLLRRTQQLPDLTGIRVVFTGLGDTAPPQPTLPQPARAVLVDLWTTVVGAAGGSAEVKQAPLPSTRTLEGLPPVSIVPVAVRSVGPPPAVTVLRDGTVGFRPDQAVFRDPDQARTVLADYAHEIQQGKRAVLTGTTSSAGTPEGRLRLSRDRANAVRELLISLGAPADRIEARGVGSDFPGYVPDRDAQGNLDPLTAAQNRQVIIELT
jgi:outer membrane protein OmpA-like peptidoglycan-associated protein